MAFVSPASRVAVAVALSVSLLGCNKSLGTKLESTGCEVYHTDEVSPTQARVALKLLVDDEFCDGDRKTVQLTRTEGDGPWRFRMVTKPEAREDATMQEMAALFGARISAFVFDGEPLVVDLCDELMTTVETREAPSWGAVHTRDACELYVGPAVTEEQVEATLGVLHRLEHCDGKDRVSFRLRVDGDRPSFGAVLLADAQKKHEVVGSWRVVAGDVAQAAFDGGAIDLHVVDDRMRTVATHPAVIARLAVERGSCSVRPAPGAAAGVVPKVAEAMERLGLCAGTSTASYQVRVADGRWTLRTVLQAGLPADALIQVQTSWRMLGAALRGTAFGDTPGAVLLCDGLFENCKPALEAPDLGAVFQHERCVVFVPRGDAAPAGLADNLGPAIAVNDLCKEELFGRLLREGDGWTFRHVVWSNDVSKSEDYAREAKAFRSRLQKDVLGGASVAFEAVDGLWKVTKRF